MTIEEMYEQAQRQLDTAKPTCSVVIAGVPCTLPEGHAFTNNHGRVQMHATAPDRKLAKGWKRVDGFVCTNSDSTEFGYGWCGKTASYMHERHPGGGSNNLLACEDCAAEMGVFKDEPNITASADAFRKSDGMDGLIFDAMRRSFGKLFDAVMRAEVAKCPTCTHAHVGPCNGTSPNGHFACPCGHERAEAKREVLAVGDYERIGPATAWMIVQDERSGATATLLANLERERVPPRRPIRTVRWYEGNGDE